MNVQYEQQGNYLIPCIRTKEQEEIHLGVLANRHRQYLKQNHKVRYYKSSDERKALWLSWRCRVSSRRFIWTDSKITCRKGASYRKTQSNEYDVMGAKDE